MPKNIQESKDLIKNTTPESEKISIEKFFHLSNGTESLYLKESFKKSMRDKSYRSIDTWNKLFTAFLNAPVEV